MEQQIQDCRRPAGNSAAGGGPPTAPSPKALFANRFRAIRLLGEGAMGQVYEAEDLLVGDRVAVKRLRREWMPDPEAVERCRREIQAARQIVHTNVCRVFDLVVEKGAGGCPEVLLVMELVRGETLSARLERRGRLAPEEALPVVRQLCDGLQAVHAAGIVHRDLKPANVLLEARPDGERVVLTDFGLARSLSGSAATLTAAGDVVGSPAYLAPEQVRGEPSTPSVDVFSLGVVLYELLTGTLPFDGETGVETALARLHGPPPPPSHRAPGLAPRWDRAILKCLALDPADRFRNSLEAVAALRGGGETTTSRTARLATFAIRSALLVVLLLVGADAARYRPGTGALPGVDAGERGRSARAIAARARPAAPVHPVDERPSAPALLDAANHRLSADDQDGAQKLYQDALAAARTQGDRETVVRALTGLGMIRAWANDLAQAERLEREALRLARQLGQPKRVANLLNNLGVVVVRQGRLPEAEKLYCEAASLYGEAGEMGRRAAALNNLGNLLRHQGYLDEAAAAHRESLALRRQVGDRRGEGVTLLALGRLANHRGRTAEARARLSEARRIFRDTGYPDGTAETLTALAEVAVAAGEIPRAERELDEAAALARREGYPRWLAEVGRVRALAALATGAPAEAARRARESLMAFEALFDGEGRARAGVVLARALVADGRAEDAGTLLDRLGTWEWVRQDRALRLSVALSQARLDHLAGADPVRVIERLDATADEAAYHGLREIERRARLAAIDLGTNPGPETGTWTLADTPAGIPAAPRPVIAECRLDP